MSTASPLPRQRLATALAVLAVAMALLAVAIILVLSLVNDVYCLHPGRVRAAGLFGAFASVMLLLAVYLLYRWISSPERTRRHLIASYTGLSLAALVSLLIGLASVGAAMFSTCAD